MIERGMCTGRHALRTVLTGALLIVFSQDFLATSGEIRTPGSALSATNQVPPSTRKPRLGSGIHSAKLPASVKNHPLRQGTGVVELSGLSTEAAAGYSIAAGDLNGDGYTDAIVSVPTYREGRGAISVYYGSSKGVSVRPNAEISGQIPEQRLGQCLVVPGDVNGDGYDDLLTAENNARVTEQTNLAPVLFYGSAQGLVRCTNWPSAAQFGAIRLRHEVHRVGDLNGDGFEEVAVTASYTRPNGSNGLCLVVFFGSTNGPSATPSWIAYDEEDGGCFTRRVCALGDVNGDGYGDVLIGDSEYSGRSPDSQWISGSYIKAYYHSGKAYVYCGSPTGPGPKPDWTAQYPLVPQPRIDEAYEQRFSDCSAGAGDVNGDGYADVLIGASYAERGDINEGIVFCYYGSRTGLSRRPDWIAEGNQAHANFGMWLTGGIDINGDGFDDTVIGAPRASHGQIHEGLTVVYYGSAHGLGRKAAWSYENDLSQQRLGYVAATGDLNGDGLGDFLIAGLREDNQTAPPRIYVIYGARGGLTGSSNWHPEKPWLIALQQYLDRTGPGTRWLSLVLALSTLLAVGLITQARLRRRLVRLVAENRRLSVLEERSRIARDMHDHLGANLTQLALQIEKTPPSEQSRGNAQSHWHQITQSVHQMVNTLDELVWSTDPQQDNLDSLVSYLNQYAIDYLEPHAIQCRVETPMNLPVVSVPPRLRHHLFMILEEALHNVVRHAQARQVNLRVQLEGAHLSFEISDDGCGFVPPVLNDSLEPKVPLTHTHPNGQSNGNHHRGLRNLHNRTQQLHGQFSIISQPGQGTRLTFLVPLENDWSST